MHIPARGVDGTWQAGTDLQGRSASQWIIPKPDVKRCSVRMDKCLWKTKRQFLFSFFKIIYLFVCAGSSLLYRLFSGCSEWVLLSGWGVQASHCCESLVELSSIWASVVAARRLSCPMTCGIVLDQCSVRWQVGSSPLSHQRGPKDPISCDFSSGSPASPGLLLFLCLGHG